MTTKQRAVDAYAKGIESKGPAWRNTAEAIRSGYRNHFIEAGIAVAEGLLRLIPDDDAEEAVRA